MTDRHRPHGFAVVDVGGRDARSSEVSGVARRSPRRRRRVCRTWSGRDSHNGRHFKPQRLPADHAYGVPRLRGWLRGKRIGVRP
ncbi:hypothetical protein [Streptomyces shenzhenensis]|uniref:Uncharacterized protein n=1 Tax=Streptomyces shenzhenensis TaxID=943815 RepID=A0A3M0IMS1_9ACTN|nr:hypothetical protein CTZ28_01375 [Streptomyces shenzhenensis]